MNVHGFGQFLVNRGLVTEADIDEAMDIQQTRQTLLGQIAIREQYMTIRQVMHVLRDQAGTALQFGEVAVRLGYLDEPDVEELLNIQAGTKPELADILIEQGKLSAENCLRMLDEFHAATAGSGHPDAGIDATGTDN